MTCTTRSELELKKHSPGEARHIISVTLLATSKQATMSDPGIDYSSDELPDIQLLLEQSLVMKGREITPNQSLPPATLFDPATPPRETTKKKSQSKVPKIAMAGTRDTSRRLPKEATAATAKKQIRKATTTTAVAGRQKKKWDGGHVEAVTSTTPAVEGDSGL